MNGCNDRAMGSGSLSAICYSTSLRRVEVLFHLEGASDLTNFLVRLSYDFDNIESKRDFWKIEQTQPFFGGTNDAPPLAPGHRFTGRSEYVVSAGLYFDYH